MTRAKVDNREDESWYMPICDRDRNSVTLCSIRENHERNCVEARMLRKSRDKKFGYLRQMIHKSDGLEVHVHDEGNV